VGSQKLRVESNQTLLSLEMSINIDESTWRNIPMDDTAMCVAFIAVFQLVVFFNRV
jgi:hypothetical protein